MIWYIIIFLLLVLGAINYEITKKKYGKKVLIFFIIFFLAFNYQMGSDWLGYQFFYEKILPKYPLQQLLTIKIYKFDFEKGYVLLNYIFYKLGFNYEMFMGVVLSSCIWILLKALHEKSSNFYLAYMCFLLNYLISASIEPVIRQLISVTIIIYSLRYLEKKSFFKYLIFVLIAAQFHKSAYILIFIYFISSINIDIKKLFFLIIMTYILLSRIGVLLEFISHIIPKVGEYSGYIGDIRYGSYRSRNILGNLHDLILSSIYLGIIFLGYKNSRKRKIYIENMGILYVCILLFQNQIPIISRYNAYFIFALSICLSDIKKLRLINGKVLVFNKMKLNGACLLLILGVFLLRMRILFYTTEMNTFKYLNYKNYFIEMINGNLKRDYDEKRQDYERIIYNMLIKENNNLRKTNY